MGRCDVLWQRPEPADRGLVALCRKRGQALVRAAGVADRELSVLLTDDPTIADLNAQWRGVEGPTDVLSFSMDEGEELASGKAPPLGDVVVSLDTAARQAAANGWTVVEEVTFLLVHGVCHLLGHDHAEPREAARMRAEEDRLLAEVAPGQRRPPTPY